jgi:mannose-1-phosphate guanylyltransferase
MIRAMLLAAGFGTRLRPLTDNWPKCLMPIGERPLLEYWLQTVRLAGIQSALVNTHFHAHHVESFLQRERFEDWVISVHEANLLGTAGTLRANTDFFRGHTTLLVHADNWCQCDFGAFVYYHMNQRPAHCLITMMTFDTKDPKNCGIVEIDSKGVVKAFHEKVESPPGNLANAAVYLLDPELIDWLECRPNLYDFSAEILPHFVDRIATWHNTYIHRDIGTLPALRAAQLDPIPQLYWPEVDEWQKNFQSSPFFQQIYKSL